MSDVHPSSECSSSVTQDVCGNLQLVGENVLTCGWWRFLLLLGEISCREGAPTHCMGDGDLSNHWVMERTESWKWRMFIFKSKDVKVKSTSCPVGHSTFFLATGRRQTLAVDFPTTVGNHLQAVVLFYGAYFIDFKPLQRSMFPSSGSSLILRTWVFTIH